MNSRYSWIFLFLSIAVQFFFNKTIAIEYDGKIHLRGSLVNEGCSLVPTNESLYVEMTKYRTNQFRGVGSYIHNDVPYLIYLQNCNPKIWHYLSISFNGVRSPKDPNVFSSIIHTSKGNVDSGIGLAIFDPAGNLIIPNNKPINFSHFATSDKSIKFVAKYRQTSEHIKTGQVRSEVWFTIFYP